MHLIVQHKAWPSVKSHGFTDEAVKMTVPSVKWQVFTDDLKKLVLIAPLRGANVVQKPKEKSQVLDRYKDLPGDAILPLISQQKYNVAIKKILQHAGITRSAVWLNPTTGEPEVRPIYEVMSSHSARRAFSGNMYDKVQDPNLICALTGHKEGSKAFARYRKIDEDTNRKTISLLE